jgi:hypothetical protein
VRHVWWSPVDVDGLIDEFGDYDLVMKQPPDDPAKMSVQSYNLKELWVRSDTVTAFLSPHKAVLAQRERAPFTERDMELRSRVFKKYPYSRPTPFPFNVSTEPEFELEEKHNERMAACAALN